MDNILLGKILKFGVVGGISFVLDFATTYITKEYLKFNKYVANTCGFLIAATFNFTLNRIWAFQSQENEIFIQALKFMLSMSTGLLLATLLIYYFSEKLKFNFYISKLMAVGIVMIWNFTMNNLVIFAK